MVERAGERSTKRKERTMARYLVERTFSDGLLIPMTSDGIQTCLGVVGHNAEVGVTWLHSYVTEDKTKNVLHLRRA